MKTIEEILEEIENQAKTAFELQCSGRNWHSLILTSDGGLYWAEEIDQHSCSEEVWKGEDICLMKFQGWTPEVDQEDYEQIEANIKELSDIKALIAEDPDYYESEPELSIGDEIWRKGDPFYGFDSNMWYKSGNLIVDNAEMWPSMDDAKIKAEEFWPN